MSPALHSLLVAASEGRPDCSIDRANYLTAWQLHLDANLPAQVRAEQYKLADAAAYRLCVILNNSLPPKTCPFGMGSYDFTSPHIRDML